MGLPGEPLVAAMDCYDTALRNSKERVQFDRPIGGFNYSKRNWPKWLLKSQGTIAQLAIGHIDERKKGTPAQVSMAKRNGCEIAASIARDARQILGGMGITGEYSIMRHMMNIESVITYEGTHDVHLLITGMDITGLNAFK